MPAALPTVIKGIDMRPLVVREVAEILRLQPETVRQYLRTGILPGRRRPCGGSYRWVVLPVELYFWMVSNWPSPEDLDAPTTPAARRIRDAVRWYQARGRQSKKASSPTVDPAT